MSSATLNLSSVPATYTPSGGSAINLPAVPVDMTRTHVWDVTVYSAESGKEVRSTQQASPRYAYRVTIGTRSDTSTSELAAIANLVDSLLGEWDSFNLYDPLDGVERTVRFDGKPTAKRVKPQSGSGGWWVWTLDMVSVL